MLNSPDSPAQHSRMTALFRPRSCVPPRSRARISMKSPKPVASLRNSDRANFPDTAYRVETPFMVTHAAAARNSQFSRPAKAFPPSRPAPSVQRSISMATTLLTVLEAPRVMARK